MVAGQGISFLLSTSSTVVLARLLTPEDYGLVAMVTAVTGFITLFKDLGLAAAIIQKKELDQKQVSAIFWINSLISFCIALAIALLAPVIVNFYDEARLFEITIVFALSIFFSGLSIQHNALMKRQMKFKTLSIIQIVCTAISLCFGFTLGFAGFGYWAIVASVALNPVLSTISLWLLCDWRPSFIMNSSETKAIMKFGVGITGYDLINYFSRNLDNVLIGKYVGSGALGLYTNAYKLLMLPITQLRDPLHSVSITALSTLQVEKEKYQAFYRRYVSTLSFFSMPLVVFLAVFSDELILVVLGDQWIEASYIFKLLAISSFIQPVLGTRGDVLISTGKTKRHFIWGVVNTVFVVSGFVYGVKWGVEGIAISYAVVNYVLLIPCLIYSFKGTPIAVSMFISDIAFPTAFSLISGVIALLSKSYYADFHPILILLMGGVIGSVSYLALWCLTSSSRKSLHKVLEIRHLILGKFLKRI